MVKNSYLSFPFFYLFLHSNPYCRISPQNVTAKMRRGLYLAIAMAFFVLVLVVLRVLAFVQLFFGHSGIAITQQEIKDAYIRPIPDARQQAIPKIIHQVFHDWRNESMPADWKDVRQTCIDLNPDWEHKVHLSRGLQYLD